MGVLAEALVSRNPHMYSSLRLRVLDGGMRRQSLDALWVCCSPSGSPALTWLRLL